jgi:hypothetical protein
MGCADMKAPSMEGAGRTRLIVTNPEAKPDKKMPKFNFCLSASSQHGKST